MSALPAEEDEEDEGLFAFNDTVNPGSLSRSLSLRVERALFQVGGLINTVPVQMEKV